MECNGVYVNNKKKENKKIIIKTKIIKMIFVCKT
jgi:hypothetical protein